MCGFWLNGIKYKPGDKIIIEDRQFQESFMINLDVPIPKPVEEIVVEDTLGDLPDTTEETKPEPKKNLLSRKRERTKKRKRNE